MYNNLSEIDQESMENKTHELFYGTPNGLQKCAVSIGIKHPLYPAVNEMIKDYEAGIRPVNG